MQYYTTFQSELLSSFSQYDWNQLIPSSNFRWTKSTPLSNWTVIPVTWVIYFVAVFGIKFIMRSRREFSLKYVAAIHNMILCVWSLIMFVGIVHAIVMLVLKSGWHALYCGSEETLTGLHNYWLFIYYISKFYELFDTIIIVLKKKPLIFLHVYHHAIVELMVWLWIQNNLVFTSIGMAFNTFIHVFMYYFYYATALRINVWWKKYITSGQIVQFASSFLLSVPYLYFAWGKDNTGAFQAQCPGWNTFLFSCFCNFSFLVLFAQFYSTRYKKED